MYIVYKATHIGTQVGIPENQYTHLLPYERAYQYDSGVFFFF